MASMYACKSTLIGVDAIRSSLLVEVIGSETDRYLLEDERVAAVWCERRGGVLLVVLQEERGANFSLVKKEECFKCVAVSLARRDTSIG